MKEIVFEDYPEFRPNLSPKQMFEAGILGGTYFRPIYSGVLKKKLSNMHLEFDYLKEMDKQYVTSSVENLKINKYKVHSGTKLEYWESKNWINPIDPYGWIQWYCRFYAGRRCEDDKRQIKRWLAFAGPNGRFRLRLINNIKRKKTTVDDYSVSPVIRQGLLQWGYELTKL
jgi:hypothetical protein